MHWWGERGGGGDPSHLVIIPFSRSFDPAALPEESRYEKLTPSPPCLTGERRGSRARV